MSVAERMGRLLVAVPLVAERGEIPLNELAQILDIAPAKLERELSLLSLVGQPPRTPDRLIDISVEDGVVRVHLDQRLSRPPRLTFDEVRALLVAVAMAKVEGDSSGGLEQVAEALMRCITSREKPWLKNILDGVMTLTETGSSSLREELAEATRQNQVIHIHYYSAQSDALKSYRLKPQALVLHRGSEYLVALDTGAGDLEKLFRLDRIDDLEVYNEYFETPPVDLSRFRTERMYFGDSGEHCQIRFSKMHSAFAEERFSYRDLKYDSQGCVIATLRGATVDYVVKFVAGFAGEAEVLEPAHFREAMSKWALKALGTA